MPKSNARFVTRSVIRVANPRLHRPHSLGFTSDAGDSVGRVAVVATRHGALLRPKKLCLGREDPKGVPLGRGCQLSEQIARRSGIAVQKRVMR